MSTILHPTIQFSYIPLQIYTTPHESILSYPILSYPILSYRTLNESGFSWQHSAAQHSAVQYITLTPDVTVIIALEDPHIQLCKILRFVTSVM